MAPAGVTRMAAATSSRLLRISIRSSCFSSGLPEAPFQPSRDCAVPSAGCCVGTAVLSRDMPATPAWPPRSLPRLYVREPLAEGARIELDPTQANYLGNVLRMDAGAELLTFDGRSGEWLARV